MDKHRLCQLFTQAQNSRAPALQLHAEHALQLAPWAREKRRATAQAPCMLGALRGTKHASSTHAHHAHGKEVWWHQQTTAVKATQPETHRVFQAAQNACTECSSTQSSTHTSRCARAVHIQCSIYRYVSTISGKHPPSSVT